MKKVSKIISMIMAFALVMGLTLTPALAATVFDVGLANVDIGLNSSNETAGTGFLVSTDVEGYEDKIGQIATVVDDHFTIVQSTPTEDGKEAENAEDVREQSGEEKDATSNTISVDSNVADVTITVDNVNISGKTEQKYEKGLDPEVYLEKNDSAIEIGEGSDVTIELDGVNKLSGGYYKAGVNVAEGATVTFEDANEDGGSLDVKGGSNGAAIGGNCYSNAGNVVINGGKITATGDNGAAIGTGWNGWTTGEITGGDIIINGGTVVATGGYNAAGIGAGTGEYGSLGKCSNRVGNIVFNGGDVTVYETSTSIAIGTGCSDGGNPNTGSFVGDIVFNGGTVTIVPNGDAEVGARIKGYWSYTDPDGNPTYDEKGKPKNVHYVIDDINTVVLINDNSELKTQDGSTIKFLRSNIEHYVMIDEDGSAVANGWYPNSKMVAENYDYSSESKVTVNDDANNGVWTLESWEQGEDGVWVASWSFASAPPVAPAAPANVPARAETNIDDEDVPLAGMVTVKELLGYLYEREGYELPAASEDSTELYDYAPAIEWAEENISYDKAEDGEPDDLVLVRYAESILTKYASFKGVDLAYEIEGKADDDIVDDIAAVLKDFLAQLKG